MSACRRLASLVRSRPIPIDREDSDLRGFTRQEVGNFYLFLVAICHQTSPRGKPPLEGVVEGIHRRGWDYLTAKFEAACRADRELLMPVRWAGMTGAELATIYRDPALGERLTEPDGRSALVRDLGCVMKANDWPCLEDLYELAAGRVASGTPNLFGLLAQFRAYRDPVRKKSCFLLSLMRNTGLWQYTDDALLGPPVDYHEVRGHLRIGTVKVNDANLRRKLLKGLPVTADEDLAIRGAVYDAIMLISDLTGLRNPSQLHYLFWNVLRACCRHESPHCHGCPPDCSLPERYVPLAMHLDGGRRCPFSEVCASADLSPRFYEHVFDTDYY
jgi:hypothetical protein